MDVEIRKPSRRLLFRFLLVVLCVFAPLREIIAQQAPSTLPPETQQQLRAILDAPELREAYVGISVFALGTVENAEAFPARPYPDQNVRVLFEQNAEKKFMPASNMKLFTAAIALHLLGKDKTFPTKLLAPKENVVPDEIEYLVLQGGGNPALSTDDLRQMAKQANAGSTLKIGDAVFGDGRLYSGASGHQSRPYGWTIDDAQWYYAPEISALAFNRNHVDVVITGGAKDGQGATARLAVPSPSLVVHSQVVTDATLAGRELDESAIQYRWLGGAPSRSLLVTGRIAPGSTVTAGISIADPAQLAAAALRDALSLSRQPIQFSGTHRLSSPRSEHGFIEAFSVPLEGAFRDINPREMKLLAQHDSPPLSVLLQRLLKNSDNLYAEMILGNAAYYHDGTGGPKAAPRAHELLGQWLRAQNIDTSTLRFEDGSGLSRYNLLTPRATAELLSAINAMPDGKVIYDALPIAGVDGTLKNRMQSTPAHQRVRAKTGTFSIASNLSGYVTTRDNQRLAVALYINFARSSAVARGVQDRVFSVLADAQWQRAEAF